MHPVTLSDDDLLKQCAMGRGRGSGPGGQHRNKVETAVTLTHEPTGVSAQASERRSQIENKRMALKRLRLALAVAVRTGVTPPKGFDEVSSALWRSRRQGRRIVCNPNHRDFATLLAEALDILADSAWDPAKAARRLGVTTSQVIGLLRDYPPALERLNAERDKRGKHAFK